MLGEIEIGTLTVSVYETWGVLTGVAFALMLWPLARRDGWRQRDYWAVGIVTCLALYLGSRVFFEALEFPFMAGKMWIRVPPLWQRLFLPVGFTYLGGIAALGVLQAALGATRLVAPGPGRVLDVLSPVCAFDFALSKVGCVLAGCCYGKPTDAWWGISIRRMHVQAIERTVPVQFLEMGISLALGAAALGPLLRPRVGKPLPAGTIYSGYLAAASLSRFVTGFARGDYEIPLGPLDAVQWGAIGLAIAASASLAAILACARKQRKR